MHVNFIFIGFIMKKLVVLFVSLIAVAVASVGTAEAALNAGVSSAFTTLQTDGLALVDLAWPVITALTVAFIIISLFKKAASKAA